MLSKTKQELITCDCNLKPVHVIGEHWLILNQQDKFDETMDELVGEIFG